MQVTERKYNDDVITGPVRNRYVPEHSTRREDAGFALEDSFPFFHVSASLDLPTLALLEPSGFPKGGRERRRWSERIRDFLRRHAAGGCVDFPDEDGRVGMMFSWIAKASMESMWSRMNEQLGHPVSVGVGLPCGRSAEMDQSYRQALSALGGKFYKGVGKVLYYNEIGDFRKRNDYPIAKEKELFERIRNEEGRANVEEVVDEFYGYLLKDGPLDRQNMDEFTIRFLFGIEQRALAESQDESAFKGYKGYDILTVVDLETLDEMKRYVAKQLEGLLESAPFGQAEHQRTIIKKSIEYLEQEYECATLQNTARKVYITPTYLSALFKSNTGKTFIEQLTDIRIKKAKQMLKQTQLKNYEVAEKVGYKDPRYFSQIFKKKVGLSPSEYRESAAH